MPSDSDDEVEMMSDVELSSDEEESDEKDDVSLIVLKRPPAVVRTVQDVEVVEPGKRQGRGSATFSAKEKMGYVKEYIEQEGLGMLLSKELGLVLFHLDTVWMDGSPSKDERRAKERLAPGSEVSFLVRSFHGEEYKDLSEDKVVHQAVAVWFGIKPDTVLKVAMGEENTRRLEEHRKTFMLYIRGEVFMRVSLVRVQAEVAGYLTDDLGILEYKDDDRGKVNILFHTDHVKVFKKDIRHYKKPAKKVLPVGCLVSTDARSIHISGVRNIQYQAILVLAGDWPITPHPTLFPGGKGSKAPKYDVPKGDFTFYYLELALDSRLKRKVDQLKEVLAGSKGNITYDWRGVEYIRSKDQFLDWKESMGARMGGNRKPPGPREVMDVFKSVRMVEEEVAVRVVDREVENRTWYSPEAWEHGGLKLKEEVKEENCGGTPAKRARRE
eukprot:GFUD01013082.1.p1 GENE.GFUD01013082.1~~GFUD01013082.1.p1  ORF type:complete len:440 (+),score=154.87 GFUD01013082.1:84-1403(+)